jgi:excisionase family DNA binding protein
LTVPQVAEEFQVTAQTIRNWIDHGVLPAVRVGRAFRVRREDVDALVERARAESSSLATRRDVWTPTTTTLPRSESEQAPRSVWDGVDSELPAKHR